MYLATDGEGLRPLHNLLRAGIHPRWPALPDRAELRADGGGVREVDLDEGDALITSNPALICIGNPRG